VGAAEAQTAITARHRAKYALTLFIFLEIFPLPDKREDQARAEELYSHPKRIDQ
jgi:hypothetical protein